MELLIITTIYFKENTLYIISFKTSIFHSTAILPFGYILWFLIYLLCDIRDVLKKFNWTKNTETNFHLLIFKNSIYSKTVYYNYTEILTNTFFNWKEMFIMLEKYISFNLEEHLCLDSETMLYYVALRGNTLDR